jgi:hypothetical protein
MSSIHVHSERSTREAFGRNQKAVDAVLALLPFTFQENSYAEGYNAALEDVRSAIENALEESA